MITATSNTTTGTTTGTTSSTTKTTMGKDDFFKLLISQLKNQDPLNPQDSTQFAAQLAQFSSLEQMQNLNTNMTSSLDANYALSQSINNTMAATLIGKEVKLSGGDFSYNGQTEIKLGYNTSAIAKNVTVKIYNEKGGLLQTITKTDQDPGDHIETWDFKDTAGNTVAAGKYKFVVEATANNGDAITPTLFKYGPITGVRFSESGTKLLVGNSEYLLSDIMEVLDPGKVGG